MLLQFRGDRDGLAGEQRCDPFGGPGAFAGIVDAGQRLPVHAHPDGGFAGQYVSTAHGKAEAWYIVDGGEIYLGLRQDVTAADLEALGEEVRRRVFETSGIALEWEIKRIGVPA